MNCLLISPPSAGMQLPRGLLEMGSYLQSRGHNITLLPLGFWIQNLNDTAVEQIKSAIKELFENKEITVVGISAQYSINYPEGLRILEICKYIDKSIVTVIGGPHVTFLDKECARSPFVDIVVRGEGEWTMEEILNTLLAGGNLEKINGITTTIDGQQVTTTQRPQGELSELPPVNFELLPFEFVQNARIHGMLNRGCVFNCSFCSESKFWGRRRSFAVDRTIAEMIALQEKYQRPMDCIDESSLDLGSDQFMEFCMKIVENGIKIPPYFHILSRVDTISDNGIGAMKEAGINNVIIGIESGSDAVRKRMNKGTTIEQIRDACVKLSKNGIKINTFWIVGHPGDNPSEAEQSLLYMKELFSKNLISSAIIVPFLPYPGTPFFQNPKRNDVEILTYDWTQWDRFKKPVVRLKEFGEKEIYGFIARMQEIARPYNQKHFTI